jgi:seryl-tRNA(Sec) selenium transferase
MAIHEKSSSKARSETIQLIENTLGKFNERREAYKREIATGVLKEDSIVVQNNLCFIFLLERWLEAEKEVLELEGTLASLSLGRAKSRKRGQKKSKRRR